MGEHTWEQLARPFPPEKVKQKKGQGGRMMDFISHGLVTERLNDADPSWSSRVLAEHTYADPQTGRLHCEGVTIELTVLGVSRVEAGGPQRQDGFANEIKNAYSDALKRAAMRFGVALGMWESLVDAEYDEDVHPDTTTPRAGSAGPDREAPAPRGAPQRPAPSDRPAAVPSAAGPPSSDVAQALVPNGAGGMRTVDVPMDDDLPAKPAKRAPTVAEALAAAGNETLSALARQYAAVKGLEACPTLDEAADYYLKVLPLAPEREALETAYKARNEALRVAAGLPF